MKKISVVWGIILFLMVAFLTAIGFLYKHKASEYKKLEENLVNAAEKYVEFKFLYPDEKQSIKISLEEMQNAEFIEELKKDDDVCDGYVILEHDGFVYQYKGYVSCSKYTTKGYEK